MVDIVHGAYPSMVTLKDGSTLIVYYEEGEGSNIRARRFLATRKGHPVAGYLGGCAPRSHRVSVIAVSGMPPLTMLSQT